ncbi:substrate-binding periplasmic protein [Pseudoduganella violaceinigra]|uniref:substrate-binding periplasmic protein n=1 Tax=Pseudoduganella violaceinigra TaxID=246602 RepID=UPI00040021F1|nr:transporter substrate-binding domain-containing protein [Pseudoduganella violaceinigra]
MKVFIALCICLALPARAEELQLSVMSRSNTHADLWRAAEVAFQRVGVKAVVREVSPERSAVLANEGGTDGDVGRSSGLEQHYPSLVRVPEPIYHYAPTAFAYRRFDVSAGWESLRSHTVCIRRGLRQTELHTREVQRQMLPDEAAMLRMLAAGGCDVAIIERNNNLARAAMEADPRLQRLLPPMEVMPLYIYLNKRHAALVPKLAAALRQMRADGSMHRLLGEGE